MEPREIMPTARIQERSSRVAEQLARTTRWFLVLLDDMVEVYNEELLAGEVAITSKEMLEILKDKGVVPDDERHIAVPCREPAQMLRRPPAAKCLCVGL